MTPVQTCLFCTGVLQNCCDAGETKIREKYNSLSSPR